MLEVVTMADVANVRQQRIFGREAPFMGTASCGPRPHVLLVAGDLADAGVAHLQPVEIGAYSQGGMEKLCLGGVFVFRFLEQCISDALEALAVE